MKAVVHGYYEFNINNTQDKVMYGGEWLDIHEDMEGEPYFIAQDGDAVYFEVID